MNNIRYYRKLNKLSQTELAKILHVDQTAISQWETGKTYPSIETAKHMASYFEVTIEQLLNFSPPKEPEPPEPPNPLSQVIDSLDESETQRVMDFICGLKAAHNKI